MPDIDIFSGFPLREVLMTILQTAMVYWFILLGLKLAGRRLFAEKGPQDLVMLLLVAEACGPGLANEEAGFWGVVASVGTILVMGAVIERIPALCDFLEGEKVLIFHDGYLDHALLQKYLLQVRDLEEMAREYGVESYHDFQSVYLEGNGDLTGILKTSTGNKQYYRPVTGRRL